MLWYLSTGHEQKQGTGTLIQQLFTQLLLYNGQLECEGCVDS